MPPEHDEVARWLEKARHDAAVAKLIVHAGGGEFDIAAFHCQQAVEKLLKAYLVAVRQPFEKIHDLGRLLDICASHDRTFESLRDDVEPLTIFAVAYRYPGPAKPSLDEVRDAIGVVDRVIEFVRARTGTS